MGKSGKYKFLFFDADKTLFDFDKAEEIALEKTLRHYGFDYDKAVHLAKYRTYNHKVWKLFEEGKTTPDKLKVDRFRMMFDDIGYTVNIPEFSEVYLDNLSQVRELLPGAYELLEKLHGNFKMVILTNGLKKVQRSRFEASIVRPFFEEIIISEEIGCAKPCTEIFEFAARKLNCSDKSKILMIGDNLTSDIQGGINFGVDTCWYNPNGTPVETEIKPTYIIKKLDELIKLLFIN